MDFAAPDDDTVLAVCEVVDGAAVSGFQFSLIATRGDGRHWSLTVNHPDLGRPAIGASIEFARRPLVLTPELLLTIPLPIHKAYGITLPVLPVIAEAEACAEKLARYRRTALGRDVYDLAQFAGRPVDERLVRRLWVLKVWADVVDDGRGSGPLDPHDCSCPAASETSLPTPSVPSPDPWTWRHGNAPVRDRFGFLADLDQDERRWTACDPRHRDEIQVALSNQGFPPSLS